MLEKLVLPVITTESTEESLRELERTNVPKMLYAHYTPLVAAVSTSINLLGLTREQVVLFEHGAHQHEGSARGGPNYNGIVSHYFALHTNENELGVDYRAFDEGCQPDLVDFHQSFVEREIVEQGYKKFGDIDYQKLFQRIKDLSVWGWDNLVSQVLETTKEGKVPIHFSCSTLNDPNLKENKFWQLPGMHLHFCDVSEIFATLASCYSYTMQPSDQPLTIIGKMYDNPELRQEMFKRQFGLDPDLALREHWIEDIGKNPTFYWLNQEVKAHKDYLV